MSEVPSGTPKRKRGEDVVLTPSQFSFEVALNGQPVERTASPRFAVAHRFKNLGPQSESSAGSPTSRGVAFRSGHSEESDACEEKKHDDEQRSTKRQRSSSEVLDAQTLRPADGVSSGGAKCAANSDSGCSNVKPAATVPSEPLTPRKPKTEDLAPDGPLSVNEDTDPSILNIPHAVTPDRKRAGTPPLKAKNQPPTGAQTIQEDSDVVDPVRAALTWHDDEITIYDPDDEDDDGTGVNGIGFKPSPAIREAQKAKRRQQLTDWRRREESDARARRTQRRRGYQPSPSLSSPPGSQGSTLEGRTPRKVRFRDADNKAAGNATE